mmetsp:Transcript_25275/g.58555  ORF Transcript_25275/g.58555 Transcript_25275/m.58555 type:complete len:282 (-) Transcript_25275:326-1171(-)
MARKRYASAFCSQRPLPMAPERSRPGGHYRLSTLPRRLQQALDLGQEIALLEAVGRVHTALLEDSLELLDAQARGVTRDGRGRRLGNALFEEGLEVRQLLGGRLVRHPRVWLEVDVCSHLLHRLRRDLAKEEGHNHVVCAVTVQHRDLVGEERGAQHRRYLLAHHEPPAEEEAAPQGLLVCHGREARDRGPLAEAAHNHPRRRDPGRNLIGNELVHVLNRLLCTLLVIGGVWGKALDVSPCWTRRTHVDRNRACGSRGEDEFAVRETHLGGDGRPAGTLVA